MANEIPTIEPTEIFANTTNKWTKSLSDYPANDGWTLTYYFVHATAANNKSKVATASGADFLITLSATDTTSYTVGTYDWFSKASKNGEVYVVGTGRVVVKADPANAATARSLTHAETMLAAIRAALEGSASSDVLEYTIEGRQLKRIPKKDLLEMEQKYATRVANEQASIAQANGTYESKNVRVSFRSPS
jgi:hypothetical protein